LTTLRIPTARVFTPLLEPARYKGAYGGRGSGKTHFFGELAVEHALSFPGESGEGLRLICIREVQKDLSQSSKLIIEDKIARHNLTAADGFKIWKDRIETPKDGIIIFKGMNDYSAESAKSLEGFKRAWIDEAQTLSARSLSLLRPTIHRWPGSEIWTSWNPTRKADAVDDFFRGPQGLPRGAVCVRANWQDNPFWNESAEEERLTELERYPDRYDHTYDGGYAKAFEGAYFAGMLADAKIKGRIGKVDADPLLPLRAFHDLGGSSANADAYTIWIVQWVGQEIRVLDYYESVGQVLAHHVNWMRKNGYSDAINYLPHDGARPDGVVGNRYEDHWRQAGFNVEPSIKNQGPGAASIRIEAVRRLGPKMWFNEATTEAGRDALGFYHERKDDKRNIGLGPQHDWSSHAADSFGLMACCYEEPGRKAGFGREIKYRDQGYA
jgi:phage terminase large subunit